MVAGLHEKRDRRRKRAIGASIGSIIKQPMPFKEKAIVRHRLRPDWGVGRVLLRSEEYLQIDFTGGGLKKLKTVIADEHLLAATDDEFKASKPASVKPSRAKAAKTVAASEPPAAKQKKLTRRMV
jgi:hypothetical protein